MSYNFTTNVDFEGHLARNAGTPLLGTDLATKAYVDAVVTGLQIKGACDALSSTNIATLSGLATTVDTVALNTDGMRVLLIAQTSAINNGPWLVHSGAWTRPADFAAGSHAAGAFMFVSGGSTWINSSWVCNSPGGSDVVGTNTLTFTEFANAGNITAGAGLLKTGNVIDIICSDGSISVAADSIAVGVLANDAQHGNRGGGALHANATTSVAGFMSSTDKTTINTATFITRSTTAAPGAGFSLAALGAGLLQQTVSGSVATPAAVFISAGRIPIGTSAGTVITTADLVYDTSVDQLQLGGDLSVAGQSSTNIMQLISLSGAGQGMVKADIGGFLVTAGAGTDFEVPLTFNTGVTRSGNVVQNDVLTGKLGNQSWKGGLANGDSLQIDASFGSNGGPFTMRASKHIWAIVSPTSNMTAGTEEIGHDFQARTRTWAAGALTTQREIVFKRPTYAFASASTLTKATTVSITGAPAAGPNATITNAYALEVEAGPVRFASDLTVGNFLTVNQISTLTGHVDMNGGGSVNGAGNGFFVNGTGGGVTFAVTNSGDCDLQHDVSVGRNLSVTGTITATGSATLNAGGNVFHQLTVNAFGDPWAIDALGDVRVRTDFMVQDTTFGTAFEAKVTGAGVKQLAFYGATPSAKLTVSGSRGGNAALLSLVTALNTLGLINDTTT
jgi:hypothetical protein